MIINSLWKFTFEFSKLSRSLIAGLLLLLATTQASAETNWPRMTYSNDGTPISYEVYGEGEPTLVFVHGWSCDSRYWRAQIPAFSRKNRVLLLDLAGHGNSGLSRTKYTMEAFGDDVRAVIEATDSDRVVLIGHSMGGSVIAQAAYLMPDRVIGLISVDALENIEYPLSREELDGMTAPLKKNFPVGSRQFVTDMLRPKTDLKLREWILADMSAAPPHVALSAIEEMMTQYVTGNAAKIFEKVRIPIVAVNSDLWPINYEGNRRHMLSFDAIVLKETDHFLMMAHPENFNNALAKALQILEK
ncbi:MAG: alpha/beta hydrolase [Desulfuromonadales bacterium]|nr:alpha/beta hydrolase [Desulfuromonadales bacterium]MBN2791817.1 alpha/beta hydrolase [Desulfuromonadales bacterium]